MDSQLPQCYAECQQPIISEPSLASNCGGAAIFGFMVLLQKYLYRNCEIEDPCSRVTPRIRQEPDIEYDFVVIGGGSAGAVVASRLSEEPSWKVLLIEAGEDEPVGIQVPSMMTFLGSDIDWKYKTEPEKRACLSTDGRCSWPRGKVLGGTSGLSGVMYTRGNPEDYDNWKAMGNPGWGYEDVLPFFKKSEDNLQFNLVDQQFHSKGGLLPVTQFPYHPPIADKILQGSKELGYSSHDLNGYNTTGFIIAQTTSKNGIRYSTARAFLRPARNRTNFHILTKSTASRVLVDPATKQVYGVEYVDKFGKKHEVKVNKEVVVSGGAINSPKILMLSGIGNTKDLSLLKIPSVKHLPGVGRNLQNHVSYSVKYFLNEKDINPLDITVIKTYIAHLNGSMSSTGLSQVTGKIVSPYADRPGVPDTQFYFSGYSPTCSKTGEVGELQSNRSRSMYISPVVLNAKSRGYIKLAYRDPLKHPSIYANYFSDDRDMKVLINGIRFANKLAKTTPLRNLGMTLDRTRVKGCEGFYFNSDKYWECAIKYNTAPENHQAGTCKMGPASDPMAVVDHELKVHGIKGLRVMDTSIMPEVISGNTNAPAIMIGEKGAHMIKQTWGVAQSSN